MGAPIGARQYQPTNWKDWKDRVVTCLEYMARNSLKLGLPNSGADALRGKAISAIFAMSPDKKNESLAITLFPGPKEGSKPISFVQHQGEDTPDTSEYKIISTIILSPDPAQSMNLARMYVLKSGVQREVLPIDEGITIPDSFNDKSVTLFAAIIEWNRLLQ